MKPYLQCFFSLSQQIHDHLDLGWSKKSWSASDLGGPVKASFTDVRGEGPLATAWIKTIEKLGYPLKDSPFDGASIGPYYGPSTVDAATKTRVSSSTAYYHPIKHRKNLRILTGCLVERTIVEKEKTNSIATGVS